MTSTDGSRPGFVIPDLPQYEPESSEIARDHEVAVVTHGSSCMPALKMPYFLTQP